MAITQAQLKLILVGDNIISPDDYKKAEDNAKENKIQIEKALTELNIISEDNLAQIKANFLNIPVASFATTVVKTDVMKQIPEVFSRKHRLIAFNLDEKGLHLAMADPSDEQTISFIEKKFGSKVIVYISTEKDIDDILTLYSKDVTSAFDEIINENIQKAKGSSKAEPPIIKIVNNIVSYAYKNKSSDIHIEPMESKSLVRFRIDGVMHDIVSLPVNLHPRIVTRIKVLAKLRTDTHQDAQDGKIQLKGGTLEDTEENLDLRVSIVPSTDGEKVVMRILSEKSRRLSLTDLGFSPEDMKKVQNEYKKPYGMILATGPTGSGKTSTMYSILKNLNKREINIMTIEDPVEYDIEGVTQIQVNPKTNLSFAKGLKSIVRQDPDVVLVGEIRDKETAGIAVNSAMTGHLVLSTLHTNDSATAIPRLMDMEVEPFLISSTVNLIIAQRLVRKSCTNCRTAKEDKVEDLAKSFGPNTMKKHFGTKTSVRSYAGKGCKVCHLTGYVGRIGIYEILILNKQIQEAIAQRKDATTIRQLAITNGMTTMLDDGLIKVSQGITSYQEVIRATKQ